jgi:hypothetical protein
MNRAGLWEEGKKVGCIRLNKKVFAPFLLKNRKFRPGSVKGKID